MKHKYPNALLDYDFYPLNVDSIAFAAHIYQVSQWNRYGGYLMWVLKDNFPQSPIETYVVDSR